MLPIHQRVTQHPTIRASHQLSNMAAVVWWCGDASGPVYVVTVVLLHGSNETKLKFWTGLINTTPRIHSVDNNLAHLTTVCSVMALGSSEVNSSIVQSRLKAKHTPVQVFSLRTNGEQEVRKPPAELTQAFRPPQLFSSSVCLFLHIEYRPAFLCFPSMSLSKSGQSSVSLVRSYSLSLVLFFHSQFCI